MAWFFVSRVAATLIALLTLLVLTRLLPAEAFGKYNIAIFSGMIAQKLVFAWIVVSITRFNSAPEFGGRTVALGLGAAILTLVLAVPAVALAAALAPAEIRELVVLVAAFGLALAWHEVALACLRVQRRGPAFATVAVGRPILGTALAAALLLGGAGYQGAVVAVGAGAALFGCIGTVAAARRSQLLRPDGFTLSAFFRFGQPLSMVMAGAMGFTLSTQLILAWLTDLGQVGYFAAAAMLTERSIAMIMMTLGQTSAASIFQVREEGSARELAETLDEHFALLLFFATPLVLVFALANDTVSILLFGPDMGPGVASYLPFLAFASLFSGLQSAFFGFAFTMRKRTLVQLAVTLALLAVHVLVSVLAVRAFGAIGAALATMASAAAMVTVFFWYGRDIFIRCTMRPAIVRMALAAAAAFPFVAAADHAGSVQSGIALICGGMLAMLVVLKLARYPSVELILGSMHRIRREE